MSPPSAHPKRWAVILIHGVGDTSPGCMLTGIVRSFRAITPNLVLDRHNEFLELTESSPHRKSRFPVLMQRATKGRDSILFAEVFWADLTRVGKETHHLILALTGFVYGLRHIALQAAFIPGRLGAGLTIALRLALFLLLGPVLASYLFEFILYFLYLIFMPVDWDRLHGHDHSAVLFMQLTLVLAVLAVCVLGRNRLASTLFWSLIVLAVVVAVHLVLRIDRLTDNWYASTVIPRLNIEVGQAPGDWPLTGLLIDYVLDKLLATIALLLMTAGLLVGMARFAAPRHVSQSMRTAWLSAVLLVAMWQFTVMPLDVVAQLAYDKSRHGHAAEYTIWFDVVCLAILGIAVLLSGALAVIRQMQWARAAHDRPRSVAALKAPRLIVALAIEGCLVVFAICLCPLAVLDGFGLRAERWGHVRYEWVYAFYLLLSLIVIGLSTLCRNVVHILYDIVVHFESPGGNRILSTSRSAMHSYPTRRRIAKRLRAVAAEVLAEEPTHLLIIAHSQGTIIALEELKRRGWHRVLRGLSEVRLVTFGSPMTHLYQHYFPVLYGDLTQGRWVNLRRHVREWVNVYRVDDYVGTWVTPYATSWPINVPIAAATRLHGHTRYWEPDVLRSVKRWLP
jgi:hypothetical protein